MLRPFTCILFLLCPIFARAETPSSIEVLAAAREACDPGSSGFRLTASGQLDAEAKAAMLRKLFGADIGVEGDVSLEAWDGVQQVLQEHQLAKSINDNECVRELVPQLLDFELERLRESNNAGAQRELPAVLSTLPRRGNQPCFAVQQPSDFPLLVYPDMCLSNDTGTAFAVIGRADLRVVTYSNASGKQVSCYPGDQCGFGWSGSPIFSLTNLNGNPALKTIW